MTFDISYIVGAFVAMGGAIVVLAAAIGILWRQQQKDAKDTRKRLGDLEAQLRDALKERCIRGGGDPRPCLTRFCINDEHQEQTKSALEKSHAR
jgi:hypothetical protein